MGLLDGPAMQLKNHKNCQEQISVIQQFWSPRCPLKYSILCLYRIGAVSAGDTHKGKKEDININ